MVHNCVKNLFTPTLDKEPIFRRLRDIKHQKPKTLPLVLSIDEFKGNSGGNKYHSILTAPKEHKVFDILPSRTQYRLEEYLRDFSNRKDVRYFVMDMYKVYKDIAQRLLPNATIVIDKFHVVKQVTGATERVRIRIQKQMHPSKRKYFKRSRKLILAHKDKLNKENHEALEVMLQQSNDLTQAYYLKELFYDFMNSKSSIEAKPKLRKFINAASVSELDEFNSVLITLANWAKYILNSFDCPYTNGYTEGMNNKIKVINLKSMLPIMTVNPRRQLWKKKLPPLKRTPTAVTVKKALYASRPKTALWSMTGRAAWNTAKGTASGGLMKQTTLKLHARFYIFFSLFLWAFGIGFFIAVHRGWTLRGVCMWQLLVWA